MQRVLSLSSANHHLICVLCGGYLIDATTISECLHSFCKSCIVRYLEASYNCPVCDSEVHKTKPLSNIRSDPTLQEIVLKLVPSLYDNEEKRRKKFAIAQMSNESDQPGPSRRDAVLTPDVVGENSNEVFVNLKYFRGPSRYQRMDKILNLFPTRYLCCPRNLPISVLKKFIVTKFDIPADWPIEVWKTDEALLDDLKLSDVIRIFGAFRERTPLELQFSVTPATVSTSSDDVKDTNKPIELPKAKDTTTPMETDTSPVDASPAAEDDTAATAPTTLHCNDGDVASTSVDPDYADSPLPVVVSSNSLVEPLPTALQPLPSSPCSLADCSRPLPKVPLSLDFSTASVNGPADDQQMTIPTSDLTTVVFSVARKDNTKHCTSGQSDPEVLTRNDDEATEMDVSEPHVSMSHS